MITRRQFAVYAGTTALWPLMSRARIEQPRVTHIAQAAHLTVEVPAHWSHTPPLPGGPLSIGAKDGFFVATPVVLDSLDDATGALETMWSLTEADIATAPVNWRGMKGYRFERQPTDDMPATNAIAIPNPHPILTFGGSADYLVLMGDAAHFDTIIDSITFGLDHVAPADLALSIVALIRTHSWFRDDVDWGDLYNRAAEIGAEGEIATYLQYQVLSSLRSAGDNHSFMRNMDGLVNIATPTMSGQKPYYPTGGLIEGYGYISFPSTNTFTQEYMEDYARTASQIRNDAVAQGACGWMIDLRSMHGGSVSPLLTALYPFLPDGKIAGFRDAYGNEMWIEKEGQQITPPAYWQDIGDIPWPKGLSDPAVPVAVLTGIGNASAGEFVQLALTSRENLLTFGLPTGGYTTGNIGLMLYNNTRFALATSAELDVHGNVYTRAIPPDIEDFDIGRGFGTSRDDLTTALHWLDGQCSSVN